MRVAILNAGGQTDYVYGLVTSLCKIPSLEIELIDSDNSEGLYDDYSNVTFLNLRGDQSSNRPFFEKVIRIIKYYFCLTIFAIKTKAKVFHIQWENKFILIDRIFLSTFYKILRKKIVYTAHNIDLQAREGKSSFLNRMFLRFLYQVVDEIIVHTQRMQQELITDFKVRKNKITIIPHGINNRVLKRGMTQEEARLKARIASHKKIILFFGYIRPSKGLDLLLQSLKLLVRDDTNYLLVVAGSSGKFDHYFSNLRNFVNENSLNKNVRFHIGFIPDSEVETYFMAADCLVLPYKAIFQSGVIFLSYRFGLPVIATDVGQLPDDVVEGFTGFVCNPNNPLDLAEKIRNYFKSDLYYNLRDSRKKICDYANKKYSWSKIAEKTLKVYQRKKFN